MYTVKGFGVEKILEPFKQVEFQRGVCTDDGVEIDIKFCGICHSDVHRWSEEGNPARYPLVPGHEVAGIVRSVGKNVTDVKVGEQVGVGCFVDCCGTCTPCQDRDEFFCENGITETYGTPIKYGGVSSSTGWTFGGYSNSITVPRRFCFKIPDSYPLEKAGPVFCSAITMYTPFKRFGAVKGNMHVGIAGLGGLGQMGVRIAKALGNTVTVFSSSPNKKEKALQMGADHFVVSTDERDMEQAEKVNLLIDTISCPHDLDVFIKVIKPKGAQVQVGLIDEPLTIHQMNLFKDIIFTGSCVGNCNDTQEVMDLCAKHGIISETKTITADQLDEVFALLREKNSDVTRYVLDIDASLNSKN